MKAAVLGATGFIGGHIVRALNRHKIDVRVVRRSRGPALALKDLKFEDVYGDLSDRASLIKVFQGVDVVFSTAGYYPIYSFGKENQKKMALEQIQNFLHAVAEAKVPKVIYTSTMSTIGHNHLGLSDENTPYDPNYFKGAYYEIKYAVEQEILKSTRAGLPIVIVNPTGIFGDYDVKPTSGILVVQICQEKIPFIIEAKMNMIDIHDVAEAQINAIEKGRVGERYILGAHNSMVSTICNMIAERAHVAPPKGKIPLVMGETAAYLSEFLGKYVLHQEKPFFPLVGIDFLKYGMHYDVRKAQTELRLKSTPMEETFDRAISWFRKNGYV